MAVARVYEKKYFNLIFSGKDQRAQTPPWLWKQIELAAWGGGSQGKAFDPCPPNPRVNGLDIPWGKRCIVNPPYHDIEPWLVKAQRELDERGVQSVFIIPFRPARRYFHEVLPRTKVFILSRRVTFVGYDRPFPGAICLVCFGCSINTTRWVRGGERGAPVWRHHTVDMLYTSFPRSWDYKPALQAFLRKKYRGGLCDYTTVYGSASDALKNTDDGLLLMLPFVQTDYFQAMIERVKNVVLLAPVLVMDGYESRSLLGSIIIGLGTARVYPSRGMGQITFLW